MPPQARITTLMCSMLPFLCGLSAAALVSAPPASDILVDDILVGAWYFSGWFNCSTPGCYSHFNGFTPTGERVEDFFPYYPDRTPLLGQYTDVEATVVAEVHAADAAGLDFFHVLFYDDNGERNCGGHADDPNLSPCLDSALAFMLNSSAVWAGVSRMRFALAYSNDVDRARAGMFVGPAGRAACLLYTSPSPRDS